MCSSAVIPHAKERVRWAQIFHLVLFFKLCSSHRSWVHFFVLLQTVKALPPDETAYLRYNDDPYQANGGDYLLLFFSSNWIYHQIKIKICIVQLSLYKSCILQAVGMENTSQARSCWPTGSDGASKWLCRERWSISRDYCSIMQRLFVFGLRYVVAGIDCACLALLRSLVLNYMLFVWWSFWLEKRDFPTFGWNQNTRTLSAAKAKHRNTLKSFHVDRMSRWRCHADCARHDLAWRWVSVMSGQSWCFDHRDIPMTQKRAF